VRSFGARLVCWLLLTLLTAIVAQAEPPKRVLMLHSFGAEFGILYDWRELKRWHIRQSELPPGSTVLFRELTAWERYRWQILIIATVLVLEAALIVRLLHDRRRRRGLRISPPAGGPAV